MPRIKFRGSSISNTKHGSCLGKRKLMFSDVSKYYDEFLKPDCQVSLNINKVNEMKKAYKKNPYFLRAKDNIIIGIVDRKSYIIDGQHRFEMVKQLYEENKTNDFLIITYFEFNCSEEVLELFDELNKDSIKYKLYKNSDFVNMVKISGLIKIFKQCKIKENKENKYTKYIFAKNKKNNTIYNSEEFVDKLVEIGYINKFTTSKEIYNDIIKKNIEFYKKCNYESDIKINREHYHVKDRFFIDNKVIYSLKRNNFIEYLKEDENIYAYHELKLGARKINRQLKLKVWTNEFKDSWIGICPMINCNKEMNQEEFTCGHLISAAHGGRIELKNLRPICSQCNSSMGKKNWDVYVTENI